MKIYNTKHALTVGILKEEATETDKPSIVRVREDLLFGEGQEWHRTPESAMDRAELMRERAIKNLLKKVEKLKAIKFSVE